MNNKNIDIYSFFSGAGFLDLGFESTEGYEVKLVNELHKPFLDIYISNRAKAPEAGYFNCSIADFLKNGQYAEAISSATRTSKSNNHLTGFIGGPPCPDFSVAGKNKGYAGDHGKLSSTFAQLIIENQPDFFLFENVKGLYRTTKHRKFFEELKELFFKNGYHLTEKLINSLEYGAPQFRERIILLGFNKKHFKNKKVQNFNWSLNTKFTPEHIAKSNWPTTDIFSENPNISKPENIITELTVMHWFLKNEVEKHQNSKDFFKPRSGLQKFKVIEEGDDKKKSFKRLHRWRFSPTAAYGNNEVHLHPFSPRRISAAEALAIQSLPKEFTIPNEISLSNMFKAIGNGVPFLAAKGIAETIIDFIEKNYE